MPLLLTHLFSKLLYIAKYTVIFNLQLYLILCKDKDMLTHDIMCMHIFVFPVLTDVYMLGVDMNGDKRFRLSSISQASSHTFLKMY